jgi:regulator of sigma E protease
MLISATDPRDHKKVGDEDLLEASGGKLIAHGVRPGSQAAQAGLKPGDVIVGLKLDGEEQTNPDNGNVDAVAFSAAMFAASRAATTPEITFQVQRDGGTKDIKVSPDSKGPESGAYMEVATAELRSDPVTYGLIESVEQGFYHSKKVGYKIMMTLSALVTGRVKIWHLGGPVVIAKRSYSLAQWGIGTLIFFLAFISINLAIVNMIPLPVLDGGQWLIVTIEAIRGKPLPEKAMTWVSLPSFIAVLLLMAFVLANDLVTVFWRKWV